MEDSLKTLLDNPPDILREAAEVLLRCASNILREPDNMKYRRIRIARVETRLLTAAGAVECLFNAGFEEDGEFFTLPATAPLDNLKKLHNLLTEKHQEVKVKHSGSSNEVRSTTKNPAANQPAVPQSLLLSELDLIPKLLSYVDKVRNYTRPGVFEKARACMPLSQMRQAAEESFRQLGPDGGSIDDQLLLELLSWFKGSFFQWIDTPTCSACQGPTQSCGHVIPNDEEVAHQGDRVECYQCLSSSCSRLTRFPRYNDPVRLLETRVGRCGEWANCFTLCCLAAGLEARFVVDWTDHVWTEVYSSARRRWMHADPCENACDKPLLYEAGWGKKLSYVIAFSPDDVQDVTWRYTSHADEVLGRRTLARETWLTHVIIGLRKQTQDGAMRDGRMTPDRRQQLLVRTVNELVELITSASIVSNTHGLGGRTTGSLQWRQARGELGAAAANFVPYVITPTTDEACQKLLEIRYSCTEDKYVRGSANHPVVVKGWKSMVFETKSMLRKLEHDWKMVYLARQEGTESGRLVWKFDLASSEVCVESLEVKVSEYCVENGRVRWTVCGNDECVVIKAGESQIIDVMASCTEFQLKAELCEGSGNVAWQHAQLFRQQLTDTDYPFHVRVQLRPKQ